MTRLTRVMLGYSTTICQLFFGWFFFLFFFFPLVYCSTLAAKEFMHVYTYSQCGVSEGNGRESYKSLGVMICELKDQDSNMTAVGSGLRLVEPFFLQFIIGCLIQSRSFSLCTYARNHIGSA